jgi:hypothetical protein
MSPRRSRTAAPALTRARRRNGIGRDVEQDAAGAVHAQAHLARVLVDDEVEQVACDADQALVHRLRRDGLEGHLDTCTRGVALTQAAKGVVEAGRRAGRGVQRGDHRAHGRGRSRELPRVVPQRSPRRRPDALGHVGHGVEHCLAQRHAHAHPLDARGVGHPGRHAHTLTIKAAYARQQRATLRGEGGAHRGGPAEQDRPGGKVSAARAQQGDPHHRAGAQEGDLRGAQQQRAADDDHEHDVEHHRVGASRRRGGAAEQEHLDNKGHRYRPPR